MTVFLSLFFSQSVPPCLSRKPKRAESEIPSLPEAGPVQLSFERQHGKINGHLLGEPLCCAVLLPDDQTALGPIDCSRLLLLLGWPRLFTLGGLSTLHSHQDLCILPLSPCLCLRSYLPPSSLFLRLSNPSPRFLIAFLDAVPPPRRRALTTKPANNFNSSRQSLFH